MDKKLIKDLLLVVWWALKLYTKRLRCVCAYGIKYREHFQKLYTFYAIELPSMKVV